MSTYRIADLVVDMECSGDTLLSRAEPYQVSKPNRTDITIHVNDNELRKSKAPYPDLSLDEWAYILTGFIFSRDLLAYNGFCLHASAVALDNQAFLFSAPCGTGKSTHTSLWRQYFGTDRALIINDDKPALRLLDDNFCVYGTPWSGKSDLNMDITVPLKAIVFLEQAEHNQVVRLENKEAVKMLIHQSLRFNLDRTGMVRLLELLDALLNRIPVYQMQCNISVEAVKLVYQTISR